MLSKTRKTHTNRRTIGLLIHAISGVGQAIFLGIVDAARELDVNVVCVDGEPLCNPNDGQGNVLYEMVPKTIDGFIFWGSGGFNYVSHTEFTHFLHRYRPRPMVTFGGVPVEGVPCLLPNTRQGIYSVVTHLIQTHGYRRIVYIRGEHVESPHRYKGYVDALADNGIPLDPALIIGDQAELGTSENGATAVNELLDERRLSPVDDVDAIMGASDMLAIGAITALQQRGFQVPDDVAVAGFDDHARAAITTPTLTTAHQPFYDVGRQAVNLILRMLRGGEEVPAVVEVPAPLIVRESCGCYSSSVSMAAASKSPAHTELRDSTLQAVRAEDILAEIKRAPVFSHQTLSSEWMRRLVEGFLAELCDDSPGIFLNTLRQIITTLVMHTTDAGAEHEVGILPNVITSLRQALFPYYAVSSNQREQAEHIWQQARIIIGEAQGRLREQIAFEMEEQARVIQEFGKSLITNFNIQELKETLVKGLPNLGIHSCAVALYDDPQPYAYPQPAPEWSQVLLAYDEHGQHDVTSSACRFQTHQFFPAHLLPHDRRYNLIVEALYFRDQQIGFMTLEMGPRKGSVYDLLRSQISSALQGALLVDRIRANNAEIARQKYILDTFMENVPDSIYFKDRKSRIIHANRAHALKFGLNSVAEEMGKTDFDFFPEEQARPKYEQEQEILRTGQALLDLEEHTSGDRWVLTTKMPLRDENGAIIGIFGISRDITELKKAQAELEQRSIELAASNDKIQILNERLKDENIRMHAEMDLARKIQTSLLPENVKNIHPDFEIAAIMLPAEEVGGDYYDIALDREGAVWFAIGDVSGHGVTPGLIMMMAQTVHTTITTNFQANARDVVTMINKVLFKNVRGRLHEDHFMTFMTLKYLGEGRFQYAGAHLDLLVYRQSAQSCERIDTTGTYLNFIDDIAQCIKNSEFTLKVGDVLVLYTDGLTETFNPQGEILDIHRFIEIVQRHVEQQVENLRDAIISDVMDWCQERQMDDMSLVVVRRIK